MTDAEKTGVPPKATTREWIGLGVIAIACVLYAMDLTVLYLAVPQITEQLKPSSSELLWIVDIYGFMVAGWLVTMGTLGDRIGRRRLLLIGAAAFGVMSVVVAFSTSPAMLIAARAGQGIAGACLAPSTLALVRNMFHDDRERAFAIGVWVAAFSAGAVVGPVFGGLILTHFWWGAVFLANLPVMLALLILGPFFLPEYRDENAGRIDLLSAGQSIAAVLLIMYGVKRIAESGWSPVFALAIFAGAGLAVAFVRRQRHLADPLFDIELFSKPSFVAALVTNMLGLFTVLGAFLFIAQYLQLVLGMSVLEAGLWTAPTGVVFALGSVAAPLLTRHFSTVTILVAGFLVAAFGFALMGALSSAQGPALIFTSMMIFCAGISPLGAVTTDIIMSEAPPKRAGAASAISETSFEFGAAAGVAVLGSIVTALYRGHMQQLNIAGLPGDALSAAHDTLGSAVAVASKLPDELRRQLLESARSAFVDAVEISGIIAAICSLLAAGVAYAYLRPISQNR